MNNFNIPSSAKILSPLQMNNIKFVRNHTLVTPKVLAREACECPENSVSLHSQPKNNQ